MNSAELRETYNDNLPKITQYYSELGQNLALFDKFKRLAASAEYAQLSPARRRIIDNELRDFRLGGAELPAEQKQRFMAIRERLSALSSRFSDNLLDATNAWSWRTDAKSLLAGIPDERVGSRARSRRGRWPARLAIHAARPVVLAGDAIRGEPRVARGALSRLRDARRRVRQAGNGTTDR